MRKRNFHDDWRSSRMLATKANAVNQRDYIFFISKLNCPEAVIEALSQ